MSGQVEQFKAYFATHLVPAALFSLGLLFLLFLFHERGVSFSKWRQYLDKEVIIEADGVTPSYLAPKRRRH
tara:strand:+ start:236 stop:448 length:213 start_codon:yes stop_codon:yes gene_type:complete